MHKRYLELTDAEKKKYGYPELPYNQQLRKAIEQFLSWYETIEGSVKNLQTEKKLCSPTLELAGTVDLICELDGKLTIIDWKTGSGIYPEYILQMAAYVMMYEEEFGKTVDQVGVVNCSVKAPFKTFFTDEIQRAKDIYKLLLNLDREFRLLEESMKGV